MIAGDEIISDAFNFQKWTPGPSNRTVRYTGQTPYPLSSLQINIRQYRHTASQETSCHRGKMHKYQTTAVTLLLFFYPWAGLIFTFLLLVLQIILRFLSCRLLSTVTTNLGFLIFVSATFLLVIHSGLFIIMVTLGFMTRYLDQVIGRGFSPWIIAVQISALGVLGLPWLLVYYYSDISLIVGGGN